jgi:glutathione synthase/RimK-type ligase-like ATP-grasp enzyme
MIAIHHSTSGFHPRWAAYCEQHGIPFKRVDCYANDLITRLQDCNGLMWHFSQNNPKDILIAKQILFALEHTGFRVFPDFRTAWHFDDKVAQKYLLERIGAPLVPSYVFYDPQQALEWVRNTGFPKVFKLKGGAGSANVKLVHTRTQAERLVRRAFGRGFANYDAWGSFKERWRKFRMGKASIAEPLKGLVRFFQPPPFAKALGREVGYVYFQDFMPNNDSDTRIIVIGGKAFALKRYVRKGDFRASGSGVFAYERELFDECCVQIAFDLTQRLQAQCVAYDFVFNPQNEPLVVEISYGYTASGYDACPGYWDEALQWHEGKFDHEGWMVETLLKELHV